MIFSLREYKMSKAFEQIKSQVIPGSYSVSISTRTFEVIYNEVMELQKKVKEYEFALESIAITDISSDAPDFMWLNNWRNEKKTTAIKVLNKWASIKNEKV